MLLKGFITYSLVLVAIVLTGRAIVLFSEDPQERKTPFFDKIILSREAPFTYQTLFGPNNYINFFEKGDPKLSNLIFIFGDSFCNDKFNYIKDTYPYQLFQKLNETKQAARVISICPEDFYSDEFIPAIEKYMPDFSSDEQRFAFITLGFADPLRTILANNFQPITFNIPTTLFTLSLSNIDNLISYFKWRYLDEKPTWSNENQNFEFFANAFLKITNDALKSYSVSENDFNFNKKDIWKEIKAIKDLPKPVLYFWKNTLEQTDIKNQDFFGQLVAFSYLYSVPTLYQKPLENLFLTIAKQAPNLLQTNGLLEILLNFSLILPPESSKNLLTKLKEINPPQNSQTSYHSILALGNQYEKTKEEIRNNYLKQMSEAIRIIKKKNVTPILMTYPREASNFPNEEIRQLAKEQNVLLIDISAELKNDKNNFFNLRNYLTPNGHYEVAQIIFKNLLQFTHK